jgi:hypothetical protein
MLKIHERINAEERAPDSYFSPVKNALDSAVARSESKLKHEECGSMKGTGFSPNVNQPK